MLGQDVSYQERETTVYKMFDDNEWYHKHKKLLPITLFYLFQDELLLFMKEIEMLTVTLS